MIEIVNLGNTTNQRVFLFYSHIVSIEQNDAGQLFIVTVNVSYRTNLASVKNVLAYFTSLHGGAEVVI